MDKRTLIALGLSLVLIFGYYWFVLPRLVPSPAPRQMEGKGPTSEPAPVAGERAPVPGDEPTAEPGRPSPPTGLVEAITPPGAESLEPGKELTLETEDSIYVFTDKGACLERVTLKDYRSRIGEGPLLLLEATDAAGGVVPQKALQLTDGEQLYHLESARFEAKEVSQEHLAFSYTIPAGEARGIEIRKTFALQSGRAAGGSYAIRMAVDVYNPTPSKVSFSYDLGSGAAIVPDGRGDPSLTALIAKVAGEGVKVVEHKDKRKGIGPSAFDVDIAWCAVRNSYFAAALQPLPQDGRRWVRRANSGFVQGIPWTSVQTGRFEVLPSQTVRHDYLFFAGPIKADVLAQYGSLRRILNFGYFAPVSVVLLAILKFFHRLVANYGVAIILLTVVVRLVLYPLSFKQAVSNYRMQKLQPLMKELRDRYKNNRQRMQQELMKLYKEKGINPLGSCWPVALQLPVLFGLFSAFRQAIELRDAPFVLWITDLSAPDKLAPLPFRLGPIDAIRVLPILMTVGMVLQQAWMSPPAADPETASQQRIFKWMVPLFAFLFYNMASGLILYWTVSTFLGIFEQVLIRRHLRVMDQEPAVAPIPEKVKARGRR